ncbi:hypothetical protein ABPG75_012995 [Micractinium tetrahymenae]
MPVTAAAAASTPGALGALPAAPQAQAVEPPPTVHYTTEGANSVAVSGTVLTDPQVRVFASNQVVAHVRLRLRPRAHPAHLPTPAYGAATVDCFGALALQLSQHVHKGSCIQVRGQLKEDRWSDKVTGEPRSALKIIAEELALLAPTEHHETHEEQQQPEGQPPPPAPQRAQQQQGPRFTPSAAHSCTLYDQGMPLGEVAAMRNIKQSTVIDHLVAGAATGRFNNWARLAGDLQLGPPSDAATWLTPAEVAEAVWHVQQEHPSAALSQLPLKPIKQRLEEGPHTGGKVAAALAATAGDPSLVYGSIRLVAAMLECGVSFGVVEAPPPPVPPLAERPAPAGPPPF